MQPIDIGSFVLYVALIEHVAIRCRRVFDQLLTDEDYNQKAHYCLFTLTVHVKKKVFVGGKSSTFWRFESDLAVVLNNTFRYWTVKCKCEAGDMLPIDLDFLDMFQFADKGSKTYDDRVL